MIRLLTDRTPTAFALILFLLLTSIPCRAERHGVDSPDKAPRYGISTKGGASRYEVVSPGGQVTAVFILDEGRPFYSISYLGEKIILPSAMGFVLKGAGPLCGPFSIEDTVETRCRETWKPVWGEKGEIRNHYNELTVILKEKNRPGRFLHIVFRVFDDGVGFRYVLPGQKGLESVEIVSEKTEFAFAGDHTVWWIPADYDSYERLYTESPLRLVRAVNTPVTMRTGGGLYISIHEANLTNYAGMTLVRQGDGYTFECDLVPWPDGVKVRADTPLETPWRTVQIAGKPGGLVESDLIVNLNEPCAIEDTSWIRPMKYIGIWWGMHIKKYTWHAGPRHGATTENAKRYIDFAGRHGIPGLLIEGWNTGWENWGRKDAYSFTRAYHDFDLEGVVRYARGLNVSIIGHHETGGDVPGYEEQIDEAFDLYERMGIPAVKTGYAGAIYPRGQHHHGQWMVNHYRMVIRKAARHRIMIDAHEPIKPTGIRRTWPNFMTREGVRGMEYNAWSSGNPPEHTTILPFTRMLAGPADYTPGIFDIMFEKYQEQYRVYTTIAKQLALYVILYSPMQMAADLPENYGDHPAFRFIRDVPVTWDETRVVDSEIGDFVIIARRSGERWFIGSITDENARVLLVPLRFLDTGKTYTARSYSDTPYTDFETNPTLYDISESIVDRNTVLTVRMARGGGQAVSITPVE